MEQLKCVQTYSWKDTTALQTDECEDVAMSNEISWLHTFFNLSDDPMVIADFSGRVILLNPAFEEILGYTSAEIVGQYLPIFPDYQQFEFNVVLQKITNGQKASFESMLKVQDTTNLIPVKLTAVPLLDHDQKIHGSLITIKDLTELKEYRTLIELQNETIENEDSLFLEITNNISEVFCLFDLNREQVLYISPSIEKYIGVSVQTVMQNLRLLKEKFQVDNIEEFCAFFKEKGKLPRHKKFRMLNKELNRLGWYRLEITPILEKDGTVNRHISILKDITEVIEQSEQLRHLDQLGAIGQLAAGVAHEIKNPLTSVKGFVQLLTEEIESQYGDIILSELERIESFMNEFLMLAKPKKDYKLKLENVNNIINEVILLMNAEALMHEVEINPVFEAVPLINCEMNQIKQVLINLVKNSIEAMPSGGHIHIQTTTTENNFVQINIRDEGIGISEEELQRLKDPFYSNKENGTGLGLMISYKIIEEHGGTIQFSSILGEGTTVKILFPGKFQELDTVVS